MRINNMTLGRKLTIAFAASLALTLTLGFCSLAAVGSLGRQVEIALNQGARKTELVGEIQAATADMRASIRQTVLSAALKDDADYKKAVHAFADGAERIHKAADAVRPLLQTESGKADVRIIEARLEDWKSAYAEMARLCAAGQPEAANQFRKGTQRSIAEDISKAAADIVQVQRALLQQIGKDSVERITLTRWVSLVLSGMSLAVAVAILFVVRRSTVELQSLAAEVAGGAGQVSAAASQVASASQAAAQNAAEQAATIEETSASTEEIDSMARRTSENAGSAAGLVTRAQQAFEQTNRMLEEMLTAMRDLNDSSDKISRIIKVIDGIAFQTNILALNAAVEAARAGEAGLGFAVVADEVRTLAQRCAQAARDTNSLIGESVSKTKDSEAGVARTAGAIRNLTEEAGRIKTLVDEIHVGSQEQAQGVEQIAKAVTQMGQVTQGAAAGAEQGAAAAEELNAQSAALKDAAGRLEALVGRLSSKR